MTILWLITLGAVIVWLIVSEIILDYKNLNTRDKLIVYYDDGTVRRIVERVGGVLHGSDCGFYTTGEKLYNGVYVDGRRDGRFTFYDRDGEVKRINYYEGGALKWSRV